VCSSPATNTATHVGKDTYGSRVVPLKGVILEFIPVEAFHCPSTTVFPQLGKYREDDHPETLLHKRKSAYKRKASASPKDNNKDVFSTPRLEHPSEFPMPITRNSARPTSSPRDGLCRFLRSLHTREVSDSSVKLHPHDAATYSS
jgi:hypothetical protein